MIWVNIAKIFGVYMKGNSLVGVLWIRLKKMRFTGEHQKNIPGMQEIFTAFYMIDSLSSDKTVNFKLRVGMHFELYWLWYLVQIMRN